MASVIIYMSEEYCIVSWSVVCVCVHVFVCYFQRPVLPSPMILPSLCLTVRGLDFGLVAANAAFTALAAAVQFQYKMEPLIPDS